jgi:uncharacterized protein with HEPN domain
MSPHRDSLRLQHMLDHAREAVTLVQGKTPTDLSNTRLLQLGLVRLVEIIGEAAARVSADTHAKWDSIPWDDVVGMRNKLIHGYDQVDLNILWDTVSDDLPELILKLERVLSGERDA